MRVHDQKHRPPAVRRCRSRWGRGAVLVVLLAGLSVRFAAGQDRAASGVRVVAPSVWNFGHDAQNKERYYFGYLDVRTQRGATYSSPDADVTLGDLIGAAHGPASGPAAMVQVIRDGGSGLRIPWSPDSDEQLLPGDLIVVHSGYGERAQNAAGAEKVVVAFVGLLGRRQVLIGLPRSMATVDQVIESLGQPPRIVSSVRVIRTNQALGHLRPGAIPDRLVDGDVLVFDRARMEPSALARTQANPETQFPAVKPLKRRNQSELSFAQASADATGEAGSGSERTATPPSTISAAADADNAPSTADAPRFAVAPPPPIEPAFTDEPDASADSMATKDADSQRPFEDATWNLSDVSPAKSPDFADAGQSMEDRKTASAPIPSLAPPPSLGPLRSSPFPTLASPVDQADLVLDDPLAEMDSAPLETASTPPSPLPSSLRSEAAPALAKSADQATPATFNALTIAVGVLTLAAMCFVVSVVWTRIDRTAQDLQQPIPSHTADFDDPLSRRRMLDRLIGNSVPVIEEQVPLPDRMDYHGEELGRRRLMLDQPHEELVGPHFGVETGRDAAAKPKGSVRTVTSGFAAELGGDFGPSRHELPADAEGPSPMEQLPSGPGDADDSTSLITETHHESHEPAERRPQVRLLDRVLIAMERERRR